MKLTAIALLALASSAIARPLHRRQATTTGCEAGFNLEDARLIVGLGADPEGDRINEVRAIASGNGRFTGQSSALNFQIVATFICNKLNEACPQNQNLVTSCRNAITSVGRGGRNLDEAAARTAGSSVDAFNQVLGIDTDFETSLVDEVTEGADDGADNGADGGANNGNTGGSTGCDAGFNLEDARLIVGLGADPAGERAQEVRAVVTGNGRFTGQQSALNFQIVANFICDRLNEVCRNNQALVTACRGAISSLGRGGRNLDEAAARAAGASVDAFNSALGIDTDFENALVDEVTEDAGGADDGADDDADGGADGGATDTSQCEAGFNIQDARLIVGLGADPAGDRINEVRAIASGNGRFTGQSSALNFQIVATFICNKLNEACPQNQALVTACRNAISSVGRGGRDLDEAAARAAGASVDAFNAVLGIDTDFETSLVDEVTEGGVDDGADDPVDDDADDAVDDGADDGTEDPVDDGADDNTGNTGGNIDFSAVLSILEQALALLP